MVLRFSSPQEHYVRHVYTEHIKHPFLLSDGYSTLLPFCVWGRLKWKERKKECAPLLPHLAAVLGKKGRKFPSYFSLLISSALQSVRIDPASILSTCHSRQEERSLSDDSKSARKEWEDQQEGDERLASFPKDWGVVVAQYPWKLGEFTVIDEFAFANKYKKIPFDINESHTHTR